jgi:hypothetical protein
VIGDGLMAYSWWLIGLLAVLASPAPAETGARDWTTYRSEKPDGDDGDDESD